MLLGLALGVGGALVVNAQEELLQELKTVAGVHLVGRHKLSAGAIRKVLKTRPVSIWPWREKPALRFDYLRADAQSIRDLYRHNGYLDADATYSVAPAKKKDQVEVTFTIREGPITHIRSVQFEGVAVYPLKDLRKKLWSQPDRSFDPAYLQLDTLLISTLYQERGYRPHVAASYRRGQPDSTHVDVTYSLREGQRYRVGEVTVSGQDRVKDKLIQRELLLRPNDIYQLSRVSRTQERLYETDLFQQVQIEPLPDSTQTLMNFDVRLREHKPRWVDLSVGSSTDERFRIEGDWGHRNLGGRGQQGVLTSRLGFSPGAEGVQLKFQRFHIEGSLIEPWVFGSRNRGLITPYFERYDDRADPAWVKHFRYEGLNFQLRRELNRFTRVTIGQDNLWAWERFENTHVDTTRSDTIIPPTYTTHRLSLSFERDNRDNPFTPTHGSTTRLVAEIAGGPLSGTSSFHKYQVGGTWYTPMRNNWILATRASAGVIFPFGTPPFFATPDVDSEVARVPLEDRFRAGGVNSIRHYGENTIPAGGNGGLALLLGSAEFRIPTPIRFPFLGPLGFEAYIDAGNVWTRPERITWDDFSSRSELDPDAVRIVAGIGPRIELPIGPLRADITWRFRPERSHDKLQFAIGPSF